MAGGFAISSGGRQYDGRLTTYVVLSCFMAMMGGLLFGYDIGVSGGVTSMESFLKKFFPKVYHQMSKNTKVSNYCKFDSQLLTSFTSSMYIAGLITTFFASSVTKHFGRKPSILAGGLAFLVGAALGGAARNVIMLLFGRILLGVGVGFCNQAVPVYLSEMAPSRFRGLITNGFQLSVAIGGLIASGINYSNEKIKGGYGWRISIALGAAPALFLFVGAIFLPETPNSLVERGHHEKAKRTLQKVRGTDAVEAEFQDIVKASEVSKKIKHPFRNILERKNRPELVMAIVIPFFQQFTGINVLVFYAPVVFITIGMGVSASLMTVLITGAVGIVTTFISMLTIDRLGRRKTLLFGGSVMFVTQLVVGSLIAANLGDHGGVSRAVAYSLLIFICIYIAGFAFSWGPLGWLIPSEIFPLEIRSAGLSITVATNFAFTFIIAQCFLSMLCHMKYGLFFFFGAWMLFMTVFMHLLLPETKNVPIEQVADLWRQHWFWKKIIGEDCEMKVDSHSPRC